MVIAYPLGCINWIYFRRRFADAGASPFFVSLQASYAAIIDGRRGRVFSVDEHDRIQAMIVQGYGEQPFSDLVINTARADFEVTLARLEKRTRHMLGL